MELVLTRLAGTETWSGPVLRMSQWGPGSPESKPRPHLTTESPEAGQLTVGSALALPLWFPPPGLLTQKVMCYVGNSPRTWGRVFLQAQLPVSCIPAPHSSYLPTCASEGQVRKSQHRESLKRPGQSPAAFHTAALHYS